LAFLASSVAACRGLAAFEVGGIVRAIAERYRGCDTDSRTVPQQDNFMSTGEAVGPAVAGLDVPHDSRDATGTRSARVVVSGKPRPRARSRQGNRRNRTEIPASVLGGVESAGVADRLLAMLGLAIFLAPLAFLY
jgi:hypothetical protein